MDSREYLINTCKNYKDGKLSRHMFLINLECAINCINYELATKNLNYCEIISYVMYLVSSAQILATLKPKYKLNGTILHENSESEIILHPNRERTINIKNIF